MAVSPFLSYSTHLSLFLAHFASFGFICEMDVPHVGQFVSPLVVAVMEM